MLRSQPPALVATSLARAGAGWRLRLCEARGQEVRWKLPPGWAGHLRPFAGGAEQPAGPAVLIPPRWMGDLWLSPARRISV